MAVILTPEQFKKRYGQEGINAFSGVTAKPQTRLQETGQDIKQTFGALKGTVGETQEKIQGIADAEQRGEQGKLRSFGQAFGTVAGGISRGIGDVFTGGLKVLLPKKREEQVKAGLESAVQKVIPVAQSIDEAVGSPVGTFLEKYESLDDKSKRDIDSLLGISGLAVDIATAGTTKKVGEIAGRQAVETAGKVAERTFDTTKSVTERIKNVRNALPLRETPIATSVKEGITKKISDVKDFKNNPNITGALDDIKIMVGLPGDTPSVDMTFRAVKPRIKKGMNLARAKSQMELANKTIVENGFTPTDLKSYADAVYDTKKKVWGEISNGLKAGEEAGKEIDLVEIAIKILDRAEDPALLRTNPNAAKQLTKIAEDLIRQGDNISIIDAERTKQLLNAELDGLFGELDLSKQAKEAKKLITREIGDQLNKKLSDLPDEFKDLKIKYGALSSIENDILKRAIVFERQNPEGLADILTKTQAVADLFTGGVKAKARAAARLTLGRQLKKANDSNELIKRAFSEFVSNN